MFEIIFFYIRRNTGTELLTMRCCDLQVNPEKYGNIVNGFKVTLKDAGFRELGRGWAPTFLGYSFQGLGKFGFYEVFKIFYGNLIGEVRDFSIYFSYDQEEEIERVSNFNKIEFNINVRGILTP